jgi:uncharacterized OsmC-like protein
VENSFAISAACCHITPVGAQVKRAKTTVTSLKKRMKGHQMRIKLKNIGASAALVGAVLSICGCASPPRVEVAQRDDFKLDCTQLEAEFVAAQNARADAESLRGPTLNNIFGALLYRQVLQINYDSANASINLAEKRKERLMDLARDRKCPIAQS